jgi:hypothetical protein
MAHILPWHSKRVNDREVCHDDDRCGEAKTIAVYNRMAGTGGRPGCEECSRLGQSSN